MKSCADFEKTGDAPVDPDSPLAGNGDPAEEFQKRAFAGAVFAKDADHIALLDLERNVFQRPKVDLLEFFLTLRAQPCQRRTDCSLHCVAKTIAGVLLMADGIAL